MIQPARKKGKKHKGKPHVWLGWAFDGYPIEDHIAAWECTLCGRIKYKNNPDAKAS